MTQLPHAEKVIHRIFEVLKTAGGLDIHAESSEVQNLSNPRHPVSGLIDVPGHAASPTSPPPSLGVAFELSGTDSHLLLRDDGELLHAIHHLAAAALKLHGVAPQLLSLSIGPLTVTGLNLMQSELDHPGSGRRIELESLAAAAVALVRGTAKSHTFEPMTGAERRILHLALVPSGLKSASTGTGFKRRVVLYPQGVTPPEERPRPPIARPNRKHRAA